MFGAATCIRYTLRHVTMASAASAPRELHIYETAMTNVNDSQGPQIFQRAKSANVQPQRNRFFRRARSIEQLSFQTKRRGSLRLAGASSVGILVVNDCIPFSARRRRCRASSVSENIRHLELTEPISCC